jgi:hypothetical protein
MKVFKKAVFSNVNPFAEGCGSRARVSVLQVQSPKIKPQYTTNTLQKMESVKQIPVNIYKNGQILWFYLQWGS